MMMAEEIRKWFHEWRRRNTVSGDLRLQQTGPRPTDGHRVFQSDTTFDHSAPISVTKVTVPPVVDSRGWAELVDWVDSLFG